jgi:hypothetical protein
MYLENHKFGPTKFTGAESKPLNFRSPVVENDDISSSKFKEAPSPTGFGGVLAPPPPELNGKWGVYGSVCRLDRPCVVDEIHLRRFDGLLVTN